MLGRWLRFKWCVKLKYGKSGVKTKWRGYTRTMEQKIIKEIIDG